MNTFFSEANHQLMSFCRNDDGFAVDYTNQSGSSRGVELSKAVPKDIGFFRLVNQAQIDFWGVNFEKCHSLFADASENCECMFVAKSAKNLKWACLVELKYCQDSERNIIDNADKAKTQLVNTLSVLLKRKILNTEGYKIYLNISIPESAKIPFTNFLTTPDFVLNAKKDRVALYGFNKLKIFNSSFLIPEKVRV